MPSLPVLVVFLTREFRVPERNWFPCAYRPLELAEDVP